MPHHSTSAPHRAGVSISSKNGIIILVIIVVLLALFGKSTPKAPTVPAGTHPTKPATTTSSGQRPD